MWFCVLSVGVAASSPPVQDLSDVGLDSPPSPSPLPFSRDELDDVVVEGAVKIASRVVRAVGIVAGGMPGHDFPVLSSVPITGFSCIGKSHGYYADVDTSCQVRRTELTITLI